MKRLAVLIGNDDYKYLNKLTCCVNDVVDLEDISTWLSQTESVTSKSITDKEYLNYCNVRLDSNGGVGVLQTAVAARAINKDKYPLCVKELGKTGNAYASNNNECPFINPIYAICDTHAYNNGQSNPSSKASERDEVKDVIGLKVTVLSQQLYKQYEDLAMIVQVAQWTKTEQYIYLVPIIVGTRPVLIKHMIV